jgi:hypothetical protein
VADRLQDGFDVLSSSLRDVTHYLELGLEVATRVGNLIGQGDIHINFGQNYRLQGEVDLVIKLVIKDLEKGIQICESVGNRPRWPKR